VKKERIPSIDKTASKEESLFVELTSDVNKLTVSVIYNSHNLLGNG
jgi:hypothetical protein